MTRAPLLAVFVLVFVSICGVLTGCPPVGEPDGGPALGGPHLLWSADAQAEDNPIPDGRLLTDAGRFELRERYFVPYFPAEATTHEALALFEGYAEHLAPLGGWGPFAPVFALASEALDADSVAGASISIVELDVAAPPMSVTAEWVPVPGYLRAQPVTALRSGASVALVVGPGLTAGGAPLTRGDAFHAWAAGVGADVVNQAAQRAGLSPEEVVLVVPYPVHDARSQLVDAAQLAGARVPELDVDTMVAGRPRGVFVGDAIAETFPEHAEHLAHASLVAVGQLDLLEFRTEKHLDLNKVAGAEPALPEAIEVVIAEPSGFSPPYPVVVMQHGFGSSNRFVLRNSSKLLEKGWAVMGIDAASHGARGSFVQFFNVEDVRIMTDNFRQTALDLMQLVTFARAATVDLDGIDGPDFDGTAVQLGNSMGSIIGVAAAALHPEAITAVFTVGGGGIANILQSDGMSGRVELLIAPALALEYQSPAYLQALPFLSGVLQALIDSADPMSFAPLVFDERPAHTSGQPRVLLQEAIGDRTVDNATTADLARALGIEELTVTSVDNEGLDAHWRIDTAAFGVPPQTDPHDVFFQVPAAQLQAEAYYASGGREVKDPASF